MRGVVVERPGVLALKDVPKPEMGENDIIIKVRTASICNSTDHHILEGTFKGQHHDFYPQILGHEVCGDVVATGPHVKGVERGERVVFYTGNGAFCEYTKVNADWPWARIAEQVSDEEAPLCEMCYGALIQSVYPSGMKDGENVLIIGQGPMGLTTLQCVKAMANVTVGVVDLTDFRLAKAKEVGADFVYNRSQHSSAEIAKQISEDMGEIDLVHLCTAVDQSKAQDVYDFAVQILKPYGRLTGMNVEVKGLTHSVDVLSLFQKNILLARSLVLDAYPQEKAAREAKQREVFQMGADWVRDGKVNMKTLITHRITLDEIEKGLHLCHDKPEETIKVVVKVSD